MWVLCVTIFLFCARGYASDEVKSDKNVIVDCNTLRLGQYICPDPSKDQIDPVTQQFYGCTKGQDIPSEGEAEGKITFTYSLHKLMMHYLCCIFLMKLVICAS